MQLVKANRDALLKPLQVVSGIVERRQTLPILANILVRKEGSKVSFTATDSGNSNPDERRHWNRQRHRRHDDRGP